jgi:hypothetical protein
MRIREVLGTEEFNKRYYELIGRWTAGELKPIPRDADKLGTYSWLCQQYTLSTEYANIDPRTQRVRRQIIGLHVC